MRKFLLVLVLAFPAAAGAQTLADNPLENLSQQADMERRAQLHEKAKNLDRQIKEQEFVDRFNALVNALSKFSTKYKAEHAIDTKTVESIKKAYRELERAEPWFKLEAAN